MALNSDQVAFLKSMLSRARARNAAVVPSRTMRSDAGEQRSGPGPDDRDPSRLAGAIDSLVLGRGWDLQVTTGAVLGRWEQIVGAETAAHVSVETFAIDPSGTAGTLVLRADSTAWATQMRLLVPTLHTRLEEEIGAGRVAEIVVNGPTAPSWKHGLRSVPGRGPRDTYG